MAFESSSGQRFPYSYDQVFSGLLQILPENGFKVKSHDKDIGRIECSTGMSLFSWGENLSLSVEQIDPYSAKLEIHSGLKFQGNRQAIFTGEGRNAKNISLIISSLGSYLKTQTKPEPPSSSGQAAPVVSSTSSPIADLEKLAGLLKQGLITDTEFAVQKARLLETSGSLHPPPVPVATSHSTPTQANVVKGTVPGEGEAGKLFAQARECAQSAEYQLARDILNDLIRRFPDTQAAERARQSLEKSKNR